MGWGKASTLAFDVHHTFKFQLQIDGFLRDSGFLLSSGFLVVVVVVEW